MRWIKANSQIGESQKPHENNALFNHALDQTIRISYLHRGQYIKFLMNFIQI